MKYQFMSSAVVVACSIINLNAQPNYAYVGYGTVTGGEGGQKVQAKSASEFKQYCSSADKLIIEVTGNFSGASTSIKSNKTIIGTGNGASISGSTINISGESNIIIRNLKLYHQAEKADIVSLENAKNIWIDHCELYSKYGDLNNDGKIDSVGDLDPPGDVDIYDGVIDLKKSENVTISWCVIHDSFKCMLFGNTSADVADKKITVHHNYIYKIRERGPSVRGGTGHVFNNYYSDVEYSAINCRRGATLLIEGNVFENVGSGAIDGKSQLGAGPIGCYYEGESTKGFWNVKDNKFSDCKGNQPTTSTCDYTVPYTYSSVLQSSDQVKATVTAYAGVGKLNPSKINYNITNSQNRIIQNGLHNDLLLSLSGKKVPGHRNDLTHSARGVYIVKSAGISPVVIPSIK